MEAKAFWDVLKTRGLTFFTGVPDSTFQQAYNYMVADPEIRYVPAVREDVALGLASAAYFAGKLGGVMMQNSGIGNIINPLTSFSLMYKIPVLLVVGWRGYGGPPNDAPEHWIMGVKSPEIFDLLDVPYEVPEPDQLEHALDRLLAEIHKRSVPGALLDQAWSGGLIDRYRAIEQILAHVRPTDLVLSTTGMISREVFFTEDRPGNFYMIGSMGLLSSFGLGLAMMAPEQRVFVVEGDGSALMSLGTLPLIASENPSNLVHFILDNESYESTGGQPTISSKVDLAEVAKSCGYRQVARVDDIEGLEGALVGIAGTPGPHLVLVKASVSPVEGIPRVSHPPTEIRDRFRSSVHRED